MLNRHLSNYITAGLNFRSDRLDSILSRVFDDSLFTIGRHFDVAETDESYAFSLELPGFKQEHVDVTLNGNLLTVTAERDERFYDQSVIVPENVDPEKVEAKLEDGLLRLTLGKQPVTKPRRIDVK